jgi:hypothetical protein
MNQIQILILLIIFIIVVVTICNNQTTENFKPNTQNYIYTNKFDVANQLQYGEEEEQPLDLKSNNMTMGPSSNSGVNENSGTDVFDNRGFKWTVNSKDPLVDEITDQVDNQQLKQNFERTYMLDPSGKTAQYDITYNTISPNCCPAQYAPPFPLTNKNSTNCDYAQKYVANQYSGMNFKDGYGCTCMTPDQAKFFGNRGNNTE